MSENLPNDEQGKGRPTPSRKEAEAARRAALKAPSDPKAARRAERDRSRAARIKQREALLRGDEKAMPPRDAGPVRRFIRDYVDSRRTLAEYFVIVAMLVLMLGLVRNVQVQILVTIAWMLLLILVVINVAWLLIRLNAELKRRWPDKTERKGSMFYAGMRAMQIRRLRLPPPMVKPGGAPIVRD